MLLFWIAMNIHCIPPPYPGQSDLTSGSLIAAAGSIGIVALAGLNIKFTKALQYCIIIYIRGGQFSWTVTVVFSSPKLF